ncbi:hypothetical protein HPP92_001507 [Vanilla planifolia]|uniref:Homeobox-leucine zipper protein n=1 Tax=Vanilla planifolia TaxID=51239 RepID=A0A835S6R5_VANPL|nr:hypothetical protein HPP92_001603 [Vanilla planifolia]KAG0501435.1 hypothetical protein HPP92_001507 [Vanilla planifolia]
MEKTQVHGIEEDRPRRRKKEGSAKKRKLSDEQAKFLELSFRRERKLESKRKLTLAMELGLDPKQVAVWFQNRRAKQKSKQLEQKYHMLKSEHEEVVEEKCQLEKEVLKLKEMISKTEEEIGKLSVGTNRAPEDCGPQGSPSSLLPPVTHQAVAEEINVAGGQEYFLFMHGFMDSNGWMGWDDDFFGI